MRKIKPKKVFLKQVYQQMDESINLIATTFLFEKTEIMKLIEDSSIAFDEIKDQEKEFLNTKMDTNKVLAITNKLTNIYDELSVRFINVKR